jgi:hypothetical protein
MRFMAIVKPGKDYEAGKPPSPELMAAMGKLAQEEQKLGIFVMGGGLLPSAHGHKLRMSGGKVTVTDGPFAETKEVIGGFAILNYASHEQAIAGAKRVLQIHAEHGYTALEIELRQMMEDPACGAQVPQQASAA